MSKQIFATVCFASLFLVPSVALADAASDLAAGREALGQSNLDAALPLLASAAEALPESVEAQLALAECHLRLGHVDKALDRYRAVTKLSPDHAHAKRMVDTLTGQRSSFEKQSGAARALMAVNAFDQARDILSRALQQPIEPAQRNAARLLLAECHLWLNDTKRALADSLLVIQDSQDARETGPARVIAAFAILQDSTARPEQASAQIEQAGELAAPWDARARVITALVQLNDEAKAVETSRQLAASLGSIPTGVFRRTIVERAAQRLLEVARSNNRKGDLATALDVAWPMIGAQALPKPDDVLKPIEISGGWLFDSGNPTHLQQAGQILTSIGSAEFQIAGDKASLLGYWLATELLRQSPIENRNLFDESLAVSAEVAALSRAKQGRKPGEVLSRADEVQRAVLLRLATQSLTANQQQSLVNQILQQVARYDVAGDLETGLRQFVATDLDNPDPQVHLADGLEKLPLGAAQQSLLHGLAVHFANLGVKQFHESSRSVVKADAAINPHDLSALILFRDIAGTYPSDVQARASADAVIERYAAAAQWNQAAKAIALFYTGDELEMRWASVRLGVREVASQEDQLLAARRALDKELLPRLNTILGEVVAILKAAPVKANRNAAVQIADSLVARYSGLGRNDLADAVIAGVAPEEDAELADWALWMRGHFAGQQALRALADAAAQADDPSKIALDASHKLQIDLLSQLIAKHPQSDFADDAVEQIVQVSGAYQNYRAFDTARTVLSDFLKAQPNLSAAERIEYAAVQVTLAEATIVFSERKDTTNPPAELSAEHLAAIDALAAFLKAHPTGDYSPTAEDELFAIARVYGEAGAWPVTRDVLTRFAAAIPNFRSPAHLQLLQAATYLGQLNSQHGLALLTPLPQSPDANPASVATDPAMIAINGTGMTSGGGVAGPGDIYGGLGGFGDVGQKENPYAEGGGESFKPGYGVYPGVPPSGQPSESSLAMIRQSQLQQFQRIAMLDDIRVKDDDKAGDRPDDGIVLPSGVVLSEAAMKQQDSAADEAYKILIALVKSDAPAEAAVGQQARGQILWMFGFFENQMRADRAIVLIRRFLTDRPADAQRVALAYRALTDKIVSIQQSKSNDAIDNDWVQKRHAMFDEARAEIAAFIAANADETEWTQAARLLAVESYQQEAQLVQAISPERAGGLLVQSAHALIALLDSAPQHPSAAEIPNRFWSIADQLAALQQNDQAVDVLRQITRRFPTHDLANHSLLRIAQLYAAGLSNPVRAVETYQEYLNRTDGDASVPAAIFDIAGQLAAQRRYLEALHVYAVFVDSFPTDARAADALHAIGRTHQANEAWQEAIATYERIFEEYPGGAILPQTKLDLAECRINLGQWSQARKLYEEYLQQFPQHDQVSAANARLEVLKKLDRFQDLLADEEIERNKDDAQFQIGRTVLAELNNPVKAVEEFRKVVANFAGSDLADDAQIEIGKALLSLNRMEDGRLELLKVPADYPNSPLADDALFLVGQSYETQAQQLAGITLEKARADSFVMEQRDAYWRFNKNLEAENERAEQVRGQLKEAGDQQQIALNDATFSSRLGNFSSEQLFCQVTQAELGAETETALQIANRQDRINDAYREAVMNYLRGASDYPLGDKTDQSLLRIAQIFETQLRDRPAAMQTYLKIVTLFPGTPVAEDAAWKVTQFYVEEGKYALAADAYKNFIRNYPGSSRVADAQFGMAEVLEQLGRWVDAMDAYEVFRQKFGNHPKVKLAVEQITWIKTYRK